MNFAQRTLLARRMRALLVLQCVGEYHVEVQVQGRLDVWVSPFRDIHTVKGAIKHSRVISVNVFIYTHVVAT